MSEADRTIEMARWAAVQAWYQEVLGAAKAIDSDASIGGDPSGSTPMLFVSPAPGRDMQILLTGNSYVAAQQLGQTPAVWLAKAIQGYAPPAPPVATPAPIDLLAPGTLITEGGKTYEIRATPFGNMKFLVKNPPVAPAPATVTTERLACVAQIQTLIAGSDSADVQDALVALLDWLAKRPK